MDENIIQTNEESEKAKLARYDEIILALAKLRIDFNSPEGADKRRNARQLYRTKLSEITQGDSDLKAKIENLISVKVAELSQRNDAETQPEVQHYLIFVPGIMGSQLGITQSTFEGDQEIDYWSEDIYKSLSNLTQNPGLFKMGSPMIAKSIIEFLRLPFNIYRIDLYHSIIKFLKSLRNYTYVSFPYDWRQDISKSAFALSKRCFELSEGGNVKFSFVGHSMGGLVISHALLHTLAPEIVDKVITIGTPFGGSPKALLGLFYYGYIPGLKILNLALNFRRNRSRCRRALLETTQSFTSIYELLPNLSHNFVKFPEQDDFNPLTDEGKPYMINQNAVAEANNFHRSISMLKDYKENNKHIFFSHIVDKGTDTDYRYLAKVASSGRSLRDIRVVEVREGDETVPAVFGHPNAPADQVRSNVGSSHMTMCSDRRIIEQVSVLLS